MRKSSIYLNVVLSFLLSSAVYSECVSNGEDCDGTICDATNAGCPSSAPYSCISSSSTCPPTTYSPISPIYEVDSDDNSHNNRDH